MARIRSISTLALLLTAAAAPAADAQLSTADPQFWHQTSAGIDLPAQGDALFGSALAAGDFDANGFDDLVIGIPEYDLADGFDVGLVLVMYGSESGPTTVAHDLWTQDNVLLTDEGEEDDVFGRAFAVGDFDGDGFDDLAIGVPHEGIAAVAGAGAVQVLYGGAAGLTTTDQLFYQGNGIANAPGALDRFGSTLAAGDFDADGFDDLAIGVPYEPNGAVANAGAVHVLFGTGSGLTTIGDRYFALGANLPGAATAAEYLGYALAAGDFDPTSPGDELAAGAPGTTITGLPGAGTVWMISAVGGATTAYGIDLDAEGMPGNAAVNDQFGCELAAGQFDGVGRIDLAIGACRRTVAGVNDAGAIYVDYGDVRPGGLIAQESIAGESSDPSDFFGQNLAAGDFDADGVDELAVGVEWKAVDGDAAAGVVHVLRGVGGSGLSPLEVTTIQQSMSPSEPGDHFGAALVAGRFAGHSGADLAIGASLETFAGNVGAGAVHVHFSDALFVDGFEVDSLARWSAVAGAF